MVLWQSFLKTFLRFSKHSRDSTFGYFLVQNNSDVQFYCRTGCCFAQERAEAARQAALAGGQSLTNATGGGYLTKQLTSGATRLTSGANRIVDLGSAALASRTCSCSFRTAWCVSRKGRIAAIPTERRPGAPCSVIDGWSELKIHPAHRN